MNSIKTIKEVETFCANKGIAINRLNPVQKGYAERLLQRYTWQTSARYIALVCHPKYGNNNINVALLLENFYDSEEGKDFKESAEEIKQIENALKKELDTCYSSKRKVQKIGNSVIEEYSKTHCASANNKEKLCAKIKKCIFSHPEASFNQIASIAKTSHDAVMSVWLKLFDSKEINSLLLEEVDLPLPEEHFFHHRRLAREEVEWASSKLKQNWKDTSVAYALKIHKNCLLKYISQSSCTK
jgi:hypothetical protein